MLFWPLVIVQFPLGRDRRVGDTFLARHCHDRLRPTGISPDNNRHTDDRCHSSERTSDTYLRLSSLRLPDRIADLFLLRITEPRKRECRNFRCEPLPPGHDLKTSGFKIGNHWRILRGIFLGIQIESKNVAISSDAVGLPSWLMFADHSRHWAALFANAFSTAAITASCVSATVPDFVSMM